MNEQILNKLRNNAGFGYGLAIGLYDHDATEMWVEYDKNGEECWPSRTLMEKFAETIIQECCQYLSDEISRLNEYRAALEREPQRNEIFIDQIDVCIDKCQDNILGLREHFGIDNF